MAAGLSNKQVYDRIYKRLHGFQYKLAKQGINLTYKNRALYDERGFCVLFFVIHHASNGEVVGILQNPTNLKW